MDTRNKPDGEVYKSPSPHPEPQNRLLHYAAVKAHGPSVPHRPPVHLDGQSQDALGSWIQPCQLTAMYLLRQRLTCSGKVPRLVRSAYIDGVHQGDVDAYTVRAIESSSMLMNADVPRAISECTSPTRDTAHARQQYVEQRALRRIQSQLDQQRGFKYLEGDSSQCHR